MFKTSISVMRDYSNTVLNAVMATLIRREDRKSVGNSLSLESKNISVTGRVYSGTFGERSLVHKSFLESRRSLTSGGFFLQLIDEAPNPCNVLYLMEVIDFF